MSIPLLLSLLADKIDSAPSGRTQGGTIACPDCGRPMRWTIARDGHVVSVYASCSSCGVRVVTS